MYATHAQACTCPANAAGASCAYTSSEEVSTKVYFCTYVPSAGVQALLTPRDEVSARNRYILALFK